MGGSFKVPPIEFSNVHDGVEELGSIKMSLVR